jgi:hypothetical protein
LLYLPQDHLCQQAGALLVNSRSAEIFLHWQEALGSLLRAPYGRFWSRVLYDGSVLRFLDTFLQFFPRPSQWANGFPASDAKAVYQLVLQFVVRCSLPSEDEFNFHRADAVADVLSRVFDVPKILDLCALYRHTCPAATREVLQRLFSRQPRFSSELSRAAQAAQNVWEDLSRKIRGGKLGKLQLLDLQTYVVDMADAFDALLALHPESAHLLEATNFVAQWATFYNEAAPRLAQMSLTSSSSLLPQIRKVGASLAMAILEAYYLAPLRNERTAAHAQLASQLLSLLGQMRGPLLSAVEEHAGLSRELSSRALKLDDSQRRLLLEIVQPKGSASVAADGAGAARGTPVGSKLDPLIAQVRDMFPELGDGFVERCLLEFDCSAERTINAILEGNFSPALAKLDRKLSRGAGATSAAVSSAAGSARAPVASNPRSVLDTRKNVFDNDEFDVGLCCRSC